MQLSCPKCKSRNLLYSGTSTIGGGYASTDARYTCKDCGYIGSLVIDESEEIEIGDERYYRLPISWILILAIIAVLAVGLGGDIETTIIFFFVLSGIPALFFYIVKEDHIPVEEDLKNLDEYGYPKR